MISEKERKSSLLAFIQEYRPEIKFVLIFSVGLVVSFLAIHNRVVSDYVIEPVTIAETYVASKILALPFVGYPNEHEGTLLMGKDGNTFRMEVKNNCNGVYESIVFLMAFIAIQIPWRRKIGWVTFGFLLFHFVNEMRLVSLFIIGSSFSNEAFVFFHETFWQYALVIVTLAIFLFCAHKVGQTQVKPAEAGDK